MKRITALFLTLVLASSLAACSVNIKVTAATEPASPQTNDARPIIGAWLFQIDGKTFIDVFNKDGSGYGIELANELETRLLDHDVFTWSRNADGSFLRGFKDKESISLKYDEQTDTMSAGQIIYTRLDPITGIWVGEGNYADGKHFKVTHTYKIDGTDRMTLLYDDGTLSISDYCWSRNEDGTFTLSDFTSKESYVWTVADDNKTAVSSSGRTFTKKYDDLYYYLSVIGPWYSEESKTLFNFSGDGTGKIYSETGTVDFAWEAPEFGQFKITYLNDGFTGKESNWTYDREKNEFITGGMTGEKHILARPDRRINGVIDGVTHTGIDKDAYIGQWGCVVEHEDGKSREVIYTVNADGTSYLLTPEDCIGIQLTDISADTWEKTGENKYTVTVENGTVHEHTYDAANDIITSETGWVFTRLDPIVGIWSQLSPYTSNGTKGSKITNIIKPDGTGLFLQATEDGVIACDTLTWKKKTDETYTVKYGYGTECEWTIYSPGYTLRSNSGSTKKKEFLDKYFLISVTGAWYNEEKDESAVFNADRTGMINTGDRILKFNWEPGAIGTFTLTYTDGKFTDGSDAAGKESMWTYDRNKNVFISSAGTEFTRVNKGVKGKIVFINEIQ